MTDHNAAYFATLPQALRKLVTVAGAIEAVRPDTVQQSIALVDLTSLKEATPMHGGEDAATIEALCREAKRAGTAAVCVYPNQTARARPSLSDSPVRLAVVNNFPHGAEKGAAAAQAALDALNNGAHEIDTVIDYAALHAGDRVAVSRKLEAVSTAVRGAGGQLKTILKASTYESHDRLYDAARLAIDAGCDFVKTCTGKMPLPGFGDGPDVSTLSTAATVMQAIADSGQSDIGVKISGGVATALDCERMRRLHADIIGAAFFVPARFRFGASSLLKNLETGAVAGGY